MTTFILAFIVLLLIFIATSVGVLLGRAPIKGSCGGMAALGMETECDVCGGDKDKCEKESKKVLEGDQDNGSFYDASGK